jgi:hypothetical protein
MILSAIKMLGALHAIVGLVYLWLTFMVFALPDSQHMTRARAIYVGYKFALASFALLICAYCAWNRPIFAWLFALISMFTYLPDPSWAPSRISRPTSPLSGKVQHYVTFGIAGRLLGVILLASAAYQLGG